MSRNYAIQHANNEGPIYAIVFPEADNAISEQNNVIWNSKNHRMEGHTSEVGTGITTIGDTVLISGNDINIIGSGIDSIDGTTSLYSVHDINLLSSIDTTNYDESTYIKTSSLLGSKTTTTLETLDTATSQAGSITGKEVLLNSANDINIIGSNVVSDDGTFFQALNDINILSSSDTLAQTYFNEVKKSGLFSSGGLSLTIGMSKNSLDSDYSSTANVGSMVGSLYGDTSLIALQDYVQIGSSVISGHANDTGMFVVSGDTSILAKNIDIEASYDTFSSSTIEKSKQAGLTISLSSPALSYVQAAIESADDIGESKNTRVNAMAVAGTAYYAYNAGLALNKLMPAAGNAESGSLKDALNVSLSATIGSSSSKSQSDYKSTQAAASTVIGANTTLMAIGAGKESDINIIGSNVSGNKSTNLEVDGDINILSIIGTEQQQSTNASSGWNAGVVVSTKGVSAIAGINASKGNADGESKTYTNSLVGSAFGNTYITSGDTTNIIGGQVIGDSIKLNTSNLNIQSLQDTSDYISKQTSAGIEFMIPIVGTAYSASGDFAKSNIDASFASVNEQSGIIAGNGGFLGKMTGGLAETMFDDKVAQYIAVTMIGGAVSEAAGGDFLEGAVAAAMVHLFNDNWQDYKDPMKVALGGDQSFELSQDFINKTNKQPFGQNMTLIKSSQNELSMLNFNLLGDSINFDIGKASLLTPSLNLMEKEIGFDLGWNTLSVSNEWLKPFGLPFNITATGHLGGLSSTLIFKPNNVTVGYSLGMGGKINVGW